MINKEWEPLIREEFRKDYYLELTKFLKSELENKIIYPPKADWFNALSVAPKDVKVIILGQDPYHGPNQAHGYSFSVKDGIKPPPSLVNIYKEIEKEFDINMNYKNGNLSSWVNQGVLLLNSVLTVEKSNAASHRDKGWEILTDKIISVISDNFENNVFMLWGKFAQSKIPLINQKTNIILFSPHPSPFSAYNGFFGNNHFKQANDYLKSKGRSEIDWKIQ